MFESLSSYSVYPAEKEAIKQPQTKIIIIKKAKRRRRKAKEMAMQRNPSHLFLDALYCEEEKWEDEEEATSEVDDGKDENSPPLFPLLLLEQDLFWEDEDLLSLFSKEDQEQKKRQCGADTTTTTTCSQARREAVEWIVKVNAHYSFTTLTAVLAVNYVDRFLSSLSLQGDEASKPWMVQLVAVTCLSLAAKVEETQVPLLLDLQVYDTKYLFTAKTIQRMELLVLSTLQWKMHAVTPLSFLDHIVRRLGLKTSLHWEFLKSCETLLLSLVSDSRFVGYYPSVLATATMMRVINSVEPCNAIEYQTQLLSVLKLSKEKVEKCYGLISEISSCELGGNNPLKRKINEVVAPASPSGVIDALFSSDCSNESWAVGSASSSVCSSPQEPISKKSRAEDQKQKMRLASLGHCAVFVDVVGIGSPH